MSAQFNSSFYFEDLYTEIANHFPLSFCSYVILLLLEGSATFRRTWQNPESLHPQRNQAITFCFHCRMIRACCNRFLTFRRTCQSPESTPRRCKRPNNYLVSLVASRHPASGGLLCQHFTKYGCPRFRAILVQYCLQSVNQNSVSLIAEVRTQFLSLN